MVSKSFSVPSSCGSFGLESGLEGAEIKVRPPIGFIHIPKSGGTSFFALLKDRLTSRHISIYDFLNFGDYLRQVDFLSGHVPFYAFIFGDRPRKLCTIVRNPVDRVISLYKYIRTTPEHYAHDYVMWKILSISDFFDHPTLKLEASNFQTKLLGWTPSQAMHWPVYGREYVKACQDYNEMIYTQVTEETLSKATLRLLNELDFALTEDHDTWVRLYEKLTGERPPSLIPGIQYYSFIRFRRQRVGY